MIIPILIVTAVFLLAIVCGSVAWVILQQRRVVKRKEPVKRPATVAALAFHWSYILVPAIILLLSVILTAYFYRLLPAEVGYHFQSDGSPDRWLSQGVLVALMLLPQLFFTLLAGAVTWGIIKLGGLFGPPQSSVIKPERILLLMGSMLALPQAVLCFAMLDIFSYNSYQIHLIPLWVFALIIMGVGGILLGIFFIQAMRQAWITSR